MKLLTNNNKDELLDRAKHFFHSKLYMPDKEEYVRGLRHKPVGTSLYRTNEIEPIIDHEGLYDLGDEQAWVTVNHYNALILNSWNMLIADIDFGDQRLNRFAGAKDCDEVLANLKELRLLDEDLHPFEDLVSVDDIRFSEQSYRIYRNLGQSRPDESTAKFAAVKARCQQIGFVFADPSTWHVLGGHKSKPVDVIDMDFSLTFEEKLAVKEPGAAILKCDVPSVYQAAHRIKAYVTKYPGKELPAILVPQLCADLPISWHTASDVGRCKKAEKLLALVCRLGIIKKLREKQWFGAGNPRNRAAMYGLPKDECLKFPRMSGQGEGRKRGIYITDSSAFSDQDLDASILEIERLNRPWKPQYHSSG